MGSSAKFHDDGQAPSWALHGYGNKRIDERPTRISMMMAELPLGLSMILGRKTAPLAHLLKKTIDERPISMMMVDLPLVLAMLLPCAPSTSYNLGSSFSSDSSVLTAVVKALHRPGVSLPAIPSYQKTAIFAETREGNVTSSNESARGWSLREANACVSTKGAPHSDKTRGY